MMPSEDDLMLDRLRHTLKSLLSRGAPVPPAPRGGRVATLLAPETLKRMVQGIAITHPHEIGCEECFQQLDQFVDMKLAGKNAAEAMPLVQDHLERCGDCREEFEALLAALSGLS